MNDLSRELHVIVAEAAARLLNISDVQRQTASLAGQWSARQIVGHLIDSAANNHQRFVRAQLMNDLNFPGYDQEQWVMIQQYQDEDWPTLIQLWKSYNDHLVHVIDRIPADVLQRPRWPHSLDRIAWQTVSADEPATLEYLIRDYIGHLRDHVAQILTALEPA
jgi:DinB superfamily